MGKSREIGFCSSVMNKGALESGFYDDGDVLAGLFISDINMWLSPFYSIERRIVIGK